MYWKKGWLVGTSLNVAVDGAGLTLRTYPMSTPENIVVLSPAFVPTRTTCSAKTLSTLKLAGAAAG